jgi:hypothetical protein
VLYRQSLERWKTYEPAQTQLFARLAREMTRDD